MIRTTALREATARDERFFFLLRSIAEMEPWYEGAETTEEGHALWFRERLTNPLVWMFVWTENGFNQGAIRVDSNGELAFDCLVGCDAVAMLRTFLGRWQGRLKVTLDEGDDQKVGLLERAGFQRFPATFLCYRP